MTRRLLNKALICTLLLLLLSACQAEENPTPESTVELQHATETAEAYLSNLAALAATASSASNPGVALIISTPTYTPEQPVQTLSGNIPGQTLPVYPTTPQPDLTDTHPNPDLPSPVLNFVQDLCLAQWRTNLGVMDCPADSNSPNGFAVALNNPHLETRPENETALYTHPPLVPESWISGVYPPFVVQAGDRFLTDAGCLANFPACQVEFTLEYQTPGEIPVRLGQWQEQNDQRMTRIDLDLSSLAGQTIQLILTVRSKGDSGQAGAFWLVPQLRRQP